MHYLINVNEKGNLLNELLWHKEYWHIGPFDFLKDFTRPFRKPKLTTDSRRTRNPHMFGVVKNNNWHF